MKSRLRAIGAIIALAGAAVAGAAVAAPPLEPTGGCPQGGGWHLEFFPADTRTDRNGDGWVCHKDAIDKGSDRAKDGTTYEHNDNNNPIRGA